MEVEYLEEIHTFLLGRSQMPCSDRLKIDQMVGGGGWLGCSDDTQKEITSLCNGLHRFDAFQLLMPSKGAGKILGVSYGPPFISNLKSMYIVNWGLRWVRAFFR